jgi:hypothetical protein
LRRFSSSLCSTLGEFLNAIRQNGHDAVQHSRTQGHFGEHEGMRAELISPAENLPARPLRMSRSGAVALQQISIRLNH